MTPWHSTSEAPEKNLLQYLSCLSQTKWPTYRAPQPTHRPIFIQSPVNTHFILVLHLDKLSTKFVTGGSKN